MAFYIARYKGIEKKEYTIEVITPMFLAGANEKKAELRVPSIKGMLRYWWRATAGIENIEELYKKESEIFGNTENKSMVSFLVKPDKNFKTSKQLFKGKTFMVQSKKRKIPPLNILHYLAYGPIVYNKGNVVEKEYIKPGSRFNLIVKAKKDIFPEVERALTYLINFGGLGARSRNGFGSMFSKDIRKLNHIDKSGNFKSFTSLSMYSKLIKFTPQITWENALSDIGLAYREARLSLEPRHHFEKRALVAKPIEAKGERIPNYIKENRHTKVYFFHVNKLSDNQFQGQILFLPYKFKSFDKRNETFNKFVETLSMMNKKIEQKAGGNKWL